MRGRGLDFGIIGVDSAVEVPASDHEIRLTQFGLEVALSTPTPADEPAEEPPGGGTSEGGSSSPGVNPPEGVSICHAEVPLSWWELELGGSPTVIKRYAAQPINIDDEPKEPRAKVMGTVRRSFSDQFSAPRGSSVSTTWIDTDRVLRDLEASDSLVNLRASAYVSSELSVRARKAAPLDANRPRRVFDGKVTDCKPSAGLLFNLQITDYLTTLLEEFAKKTFPQRIFDLPDFPNIANAVDDATSPGNPTIVGKPIPIGYGLLSNEAATPIDWVVPGVYTGRRTVDGFPWDEYVFFGHAPSAFQSLGIPEGPGLSVGTTYPSRIHITASSGYVDYMFPGSALWTAQFGSASYRDFNGNRYCVAYGRGPRSDLNRLGTVPLVGNFGGIEDEGDGTGNMIDSLYEQIVHLLVNWILQSYTSGGWLSIPSVGIGAELYSRIRTSSFGDCDTLSANIIAGGIKGAFLLGANGATTTFDEILKNAALCGHLDYGINKDGQIIASMLDAGAAINRHLTDLADILHETPADEHSPSSYNSERRRDLVRNIVKYRYGRRYVQPFTQGTPAENELLPRTNTQPVTDWIVDVTDDRMSDATSRGKYGDRVQDLPLEYIRDPDTADNIALTVLTESKDPQIRVSFKEGTCGFDTDLGDVDGVTHFESLVTSEEHDRCEVHIADLDKFEVVKEHRRVV